MNRMFPLPGLLIALAAPAVLAADSVSGRLSRVELRESGYHGVYLRNNETPDAIVFPDQGCDLTDRAVVDENSGSGRLLIETLNAARVNPPRNRSYWQVRLLVDGCATINGPATLTAPKIIKVELLTTN